MLERALLISRQMAELASAGAAGAALALDRQRRELLHAARTAPGEISSEERAIVAEIETLNNRALGLLEHGLRTAARELDMAAAGRRAVLAYAATG
jgi:hypothetical protein